MIFFLLFLFKFNCASGFLLFSFKSIRDIFKWWRNKIQQLFCSVQVARSAGIELGTQTVDYVFD